MGCTLPYITVSVISRNATCEGFIYIYIYIERERERERERCMSSANEVSMIFNYVGLSVSVWA